MNDGGLSAEKPPAERSASTSYTYPDWEWVNGVAIIGPDGRVDPVRRVLTFTSAPLDSRSRRHRADRAQALRVIDRDRHPVHRQADRPASAGRRARARQASSRRSRRCRRAGSRPRTARRTRSARSPSGRSTPTPIRSRSRPARSTSSTSRCCRSPTCSRRATASGSSSPTAIRRRPTACSRIPIIRRRWAPTPSTTTPRTRRASCCRWSGRGPYSTFEVLAARMAVAEAARTSAAIQACP